MNSFLRFWQMFRHNISGTFDPWLLSTMLEFLASISFSVSLLLRASL